jgi:hypothetical protein
MTIVLGRSRTTVLPVPYFTQPTGITCQSTCLKMIATYLEQSVVRQSTGGGAREIQEIWKDINESQQRPVKMRNAHANMKWWLEKRDGGEVGPGQSLRLNLASVGRQRRADTRRGTYYLLSARA